jgi:hypothetical protein
MIHVQVHCVSPNWHHIVQHQAMALPSIHTHNVFDIFQIAKWLKTSNWFDLLNFVMCVHVPYTTCMCTHRYMYLYYTGNQQQHTNNIPGTCMNKVYMYIGDPVCDVHVCIQHYSWRNTRWIITQIRYYTANICLYNESLPRGINEWQQRAGDHRRESDCGEHTRYLNLDRKYRCGQIIVRRRTMTTKKSNITTSFMTSVPYCTVFMCPSKIASTVVLYLFLRFWKGGGSEFFEPHADDTIEIAYRFVHTTYMYMYD